MTIPTFGPDTGISFACAPKPRTFTARSGVPCMSNSNSDHLPDQNNNDDRRELTWTEAEWELYLSEYDESIRDYLRHYDKLDGAADRIDETARRLGWDLPAEESEETKLGESEEDEDFDDEPYTVHCNPVHIATKAIYVSLLANWERIAAHPDRVAPALALTVQGSLYRGRELSLQAVQALDFGDFALAICFFKRALRELNDTLSRLGEENAADPVLLARYRDYALPRLFDLREIWLRIMAECRQADQSE